LLFAIETTNKNFELGIEKGERGVDLD